MAARKTLSRLATHLLLVAVCVAIGLPFFWMVTTSIKAPTEVQIFPPVWWPETPRFQNFVDAWESAPFGRFYINSVIVVSAGVVLEVLIAALSAYAGEFPIFFFGRDDVFRIVPQATDGSPFNSDLFGETHESCWKIGAVILLLHISAALWHEYIRRDGVLSRMWRG